jgi:uncharacterized protein YqgC (DUF456 family)
MVYVKEPALPAKWARYGALIGIIAAVFKIYGIAGADPFYSSPISDEYIARMVGYSIAAIALGAMVGAAAAVVRNKFFRYGR